MKQKMTAITLKNNHDLEMFHNQLKKVGHPLSASINSSSKVIAQVPAWIDSLPNRVAMKGIFLEIIKGDA
jgi:hypothetical protein